MTTVAPYDGRPSRPLMAALALWIATWLVVGVVTGVQIRRLTEVSDSLVESGKALDTAGSALQALGRLPLVGERPKRLGDEVRETADGIHEAGLSSRQTVQWVAVLLGAAVAAIPVFPAVALLAPPRSWRRRSRKALARALSEPDSQPHLEAFLAHRAVQNLPYDTLLAVSVDPWGDLQRGSYRRLANAELTRLGLDRGRRRPGREATERRRTAGPGAG